MNCSYLFTVFFQMTIQFNWIPSSFQLFPSYFSTNKYIAPANVLPYVSISSPSAPMKVLSIGPTPTRSDGVFIASGVETE